MSLSPQIYLPVLIVLLTTCCALGDWKPAEGPLKTRWAKDVSPDKALPEYPRPQMVREKWMNLNGLWQFAGVREEDQPPIGKNLGEEILVPFAPESALSGLMRHEQRMWYRRTLSLPADWNGQHVLLHFGAVDWQADVYVNGKHLGTHKGGYDPFSFDITDALAPSGKQELIVGVYDGTDEGNQPRGKQTARPRGIWYTPTSGIWQTVWIEPVPAAHVSAVHVRADADSDNVNIHLETSGAGTARVAIMDGEAEVASHEARADETITIVLPHGKLWSPQSPFLYGLKIQFRCADGSKDELSSYFGKRSISVKKDEQGINRIFLNGAPMFMTGPLDQGFWPDGLYTAPTDAALRFDIETTKQLGFNMTRKHVKVEPQRWYYWADKLGLLVWQDMPSMRAIANQDQQIQFEQELDRMIQAHRDDPCIIMWVVFNEGWGQFDGAKTVTDQSELLNHQTTTRITDHVKQLDPTRLVNNASGWTDRGAGDVRDMHHYPDPTMPPLEPNRAAVLGEFGGLGLALPGHTWTKDFWGYRGVKDRDALTAQYERMLAGAWKLREQGLCAAVYTQITDVETECNGLMTYDREVIKVDVNRAAAANSGHTQNAPPAEAK